MTDSHFTVGGITTTRELLLPERILYVLTAAAVFAGIYFRFKGLGASPFAIDEYYLATAVKSILEHGLPRFQGGGFYTRGIALQYLAAPLFLSGLGHEFAFRLVMVLFNLAAFPAVFLIARHLGGRTAGCLALILFSLSVWEVEFARFARMYAPLGTLFLWHLYFLYRRIMLEDLHAAKWMYAISLCTIFVSEYAIFLALLNFLPALMRRLQRPMTETVFPLGVLVITYLWESTNFRRLGVTDALPAELVRDAGPGPILPVHMPPILIAELSTPWLIGFLVPLAIFGIVVAAWGRLAMQPAAEIRARFCFLIPVGLAALALLNLFALATWGALIALLLSGLRREDFRAWAWRPVVALTVLSMAVSLGFWGAFLALTSGWQELLPIQTGSRLRDAILLLFNYPNVLREIIVPWRAAMPLQGVFMAALMLGGVWLASARPGHRYTSYLVLTGLMLGLFLLVPVFTKPYYTLRYIYFVYPLCLLLTAVAIVYLAERLFQSPAKLVGVSVAAVVGFMALAEDFEARHLLEIDSQRVLFRMGYSRGKVDQYYTRWDFRGPAEFVNAHLQPSDIVISSEYGVPYYLQRMDYLYMDLEGGRFFIIAGQQGTRDIWEGAPLLRSEEQLLEAIRQAPNAVWLITKSDQYGFQTSGEQLASQLFDDQRVFRSVDGHLDVYRITSLNVANQ